MCRIHLASCGEPDARVERLSADRPGTRVVMLLDTVETMDRSELMSRVRQRDTTPELAIRKVLWSEGLRYRLHEKILGVRPDIVFRRAKVALFVDGCFWHGCPIHYVKPRTRSEYWDPKLRNNVARDRRQTIELERSGWRVLRFWEHDARDDLDEVLERTRSAIQDPTWLPTPDWRVFRVRDVPERDAEWQERFMSRLRDPSELVIVAGPRSSGSGRRRQRGSS